METVKTKFIAKTPILISEMSGGGWGGAGWILSTKANPGDIIICETFQTPSTEAQDSSVRLYFPYSKEKISTTFENFGRFVACGAMEQILCLDGKYEATRNLDLSSDLVINSGEKFEVFECQDDPLQRFLIKSGSCTEHCEPIFFLNLIKNNIIKKIII